MKKNILLLLFMLNVFLCSAQVFDYFSYNSMLSDLQSRGFSVTTQQKENQKLLSVEDYKKGVTYFAIFDNWNQLLYIDIWAKDKERLGDYFVDIYKTMSLEEVANVDDATKLTTRYMYFSKRRFTFKSLVPAVIRCYID